MNVAFISYFTCFCFHFPFCANKNHPTRMKMIKNRRNKTEERKKNVREKYQVKCNHDYLHQEYARVSEWREIKHFISFYLYSSSSSNNNKSRNILFFILLLLLDLILIKSLFRCVICIIICWAFV